MNMESVHRLLGLLAICPACRSQFGSQVSLGDDKSGRLRRILSAYGSPQYLRAIQGAKHPITRVLADVSYDIEAVEAAWNLSTSVGDALLPYEPTFPEEREDAELVTKYLGMIHNGENYFIKEVVDAYVELAPEIAQIRKDSSCKCKDRLGLAMLIRKPKIEDICDALVADGKADPRSGDTTIPDRRRSVPVLRGAGETFTCDDSPEAYKAMMREINESYSYKGAHIERSGGTITIMLY